MTKLQTRREWAAERGLCKPGVRGRLPQAAKDAIDAAMQEGVRFSDVAAVEAKDGHVKAKVLVAKKEIPDIPEYFRDLDHEVYELVDGKKVHRSMREVCRNCGSSLVLCGCGAPVIVSLDGNPAGTRVYFGAAGYGDSRW